MLKVIISAPSNWNSDVVANTLSKNNYNVTLCCLRRRNRINLPQINIFRPPISFVLQCFVFMLSRFGFITGSLYASKFQAIIYSIFDIEVYLYIKATGIPNYFIGWATCCSFCINRNVSSNGKFLFSGNSHIKTQSNVLLKYSDVIIDEMYIRRHVYEASHADLIFVESEYSKYTYVYEGIKEKNIIVLDVPIFDSAINEELIKGLFLKSVEEITGELKLSFCSPREIKGLYVIKEMVDHLNMSNYKYVLNIYGCTKEIIKMFSVYNNVYCYGDLKKVDFLSSIALTDILLVPTYEDGGPRVLTEGLSLGLYAVGSVFSKLPEFEWLQLSHVITDNDPIKYSNFIRTVDINNIRLMRNYRFSNYKKYYDETNFSLALKNTLR